MNYAVEILKEQRESLTNEVINFEAETAAEKKELTKTKKRLQQVLDALCDIGNNSVTLTGYELLNAKTICLPDETKEQLEGDYAIKYQQGRYIVIDLGCDESTYISFD